MIAELCGKWNALPFEGGLLDQPLGLIVIGAHLRAFAKAHAIYQQDPKNASGAVRDFVLLTARESAIRRAHGE